jgi:hypothetical protein
MCALLVVQTEQSFALSGCRSTIFKRNTLSPTFHFSHTDAIAQALKADDICVIIKS